MSDSSQPESVSEAPRVRVVSPDAGKPVPEEATLKRLCIINLLDVLNISLSMKQTGEKALRDVGEALMEVVSDKRLEAREGMLLLDRCRMIQESTGEEALEHIIEYFDTNFSLEELQEITTFLYTPTGRKYLKVTAKAKSDVREGEEKWRDRIIAPAHDELVARGIIKPSKLSHGLDVLLGILCNNPECDEHAHLRKARADVSGKPA